MTNDTDILAEIERKASETLVEWLEKLDRGTCTRTAARAALRALWSATAGVVSWELGDQISAAIDAIGEATDTPRRGIYRRGNKVRVIDFPDESHTEAALLELTIEGEPRRVRVACTADQLSATEISERAIQAYLLTRKQGFTPI